MYKICVHICKYNVCISTLFIFRNAYINADMMFNITFVVINICIDLKTD